MSTRILIQRPGPYSTSRAAGFEASEERLRLQHPNARVLAVAPEQLLVRAGLHDLRVVHVPFATIPVSQEVRACTEI